MFGRIDHVAIAVDDLDVAVSLYRDRLGMAEQHRETVESFGVEAVLLEIGEGHVELIHPTTEDSGVARFLAQKGPGLHHVAYQTDDIDRDLEALASAGFQLIDTEARAGIRGSRVAFLHPRSTGGVLTELVEPAH